MPAPPRPNPPQHVARIAVSGQLVAERWANVFWIRNGRQTTPSFTDFQATVSDVFSFWAQYFRHFMAGNVSLDNASGLYYGPTGADLGADVSPAPSFGSDATALLPANCACVVSWKVQQHYRGGHPRTYLAGHCQSGVQTAQTWKTDHQADVSGSANDFHTAVNQINHGGVGDVHLGTVSFVLRKQWRDPPVFRDFIPSAATVDNRIDSMRSRLGRDR